VYIERVALKNIKGFTDAELDFCPSGEDHPGWCVITGDNGAGKSALLRAIAIAILGPEQGRVLVQDHLDGWVTQGHDQGTISVEIKPQHEWDRTERGGNPTTGTIWAEISVEADGADGWRARPTDRFRNKRVGAFNGPWSQTTSGWCTVAYGPFRRLYGSSPDASRLSALAGRVPRFATLFKEDATLAECEVWAKDLDYRRLEGHEESRKTLAALLALVGKEFLSRGVTISDVGSNGITLRDAAGRDVPLSDMSDGYRSSLAMLIDLFRHMVDIYGPDIVERDDNDEVYVSTPGVVLIDEVDAHLHPDWQRQIGFWLKSHFPRVQFIVTTHSPLVCPAADGGRIYHLPRGDTRDNRPFRLGEMDYDRVIAGRPDQILVSPAFGLAYTRSPRAVNARERHARLESKRRSTELTREELEELGQLALFVRDDDE
jgi:energy-coupling factor transporter ATP-binding protein EcfA2